MSKISTFLSNLKIYFDQNFFPLFRLKALQTTKFWKISGIFLPGPSHSKFYYITHLCEKGPTRKFYLFQNFHCKKVYIFLRYQFIWKICSFEVNFVDVPQKLKQGQGCVFSKICNNYPPPILLFFEPYQHNLPQKNKFLMQNW